MSFHERTETTTPKRMLVYRIALTLSTTAPLSAFSTEGAAFVPAPIAQELAPAVVCATANPTPFACNTPAVVQSVTAGRLVDRNTIAAKNAAKYQPNATMRRRFIGDRNSIFTGCDFNEIQSACGLLYVDGILLLNLLSSSYSLPLRWSMVGPNNLAHVDTLYGPFLTLLPDSPVDTTIAITLRHPERSKVAAQTQVMNRHCSDAYGLSRNVIGNRENISLDDHIDKFWYALSVDRLGNDSQPMQYAMSDFRFTTGDTSVPVTSVRQGLNPNGQPRMILGLQMFKRTQ